MYGKKMREGRVPPNIYKKYGWATHHGFNEDIGLKMANVECKKKDWKELSILFSHLDSSGELRKILRKGFIQPELGTKNVDMTDIIKYNRNLYKQISYSVNVGYVNHLGIINPEKEVEVRYRDDRQPTPKFSLLQMQYMELLNPVTGKPLVESIILCPGDVGKAQIMYMDKGDNREYLTRIKEDPVGFWWNFLRDVKGMTEGCVQSFIDSFAVERRILALSSMMVMTPG
jgi:hypothetical protein